MNITQCVICKTEIKYQGIGRPTECVSCIHARTLTEEQLKNIINPENKVGFTRNNLGKLVPVIEERVGPVNRYEREIKPGVWIDYYDIARAYGLHDAPMAHALKKMLAIGNRGHKDEAQDRKDIYDSVVRSNEQYEEWK